MNKIDKIDECLLNLIELEEQDNMFWREPNEFEKSNNIYEIYDTLEFSEKEGNTIIYNISKKFLEDILLTIKKYSNTSKDLSKIEVSNKLKNQAIEEIGKMTAKSYLDGVKSIDKKEQISIKWLSDWSERKAKIATRKLETDMISKIINLLYDEEKI